MSNSFAGFIMTYERPEILLSTINIVFEQTLPPEKLLIIDNSFSNNTQDFVQKLNLPNIHYHRVGYNSGPAGAAAIGLKMLSDEGYDWIYWGDDDDTPYFENTFEILINMALNNNYVGCVGSVGQFLNFKTGFIKRVPDNDLYNNKILEVNNIAGGMSKIVNGKMVKEFQIFPDSKLFYGFEELDFDLKVKKVGYKLFINCEHFLKHRVKFNRVNLGKKKLLNKTSNQLRREYYSIRNILYIFHDNKLFLPIFIFINYTIVKQFLRLKYGFHSTFTGFKITFVAIYDFFKGIKGIKHIN